MTSKRVVWGKSLSQNTNLRYRWIKKISVGNFELSAVELQRFTEKRPAGFLSFSFERGGWGSSEESHDS